MNLMSNGMLPIDPAGCPVCGRANHCAVEIAKAAGRPVKPCWCVDAVFTPELLAKVPQAAQGMACVCPVCAASPKTVIN